MTAQTSAPDALDNPYKAATWLVNRHDSAVHMIDRVSAWTPIYEEGVEVPAVDVGFIAEGLNAYDQHRIDWEAYTNRTSPPTMYSFREDEAAYERAYDAWENAGPKITNPFARAYAPMSSGEHRFFRMIGVLGAGQRIRFNLGDASVSFQCCSPGMFGQAPPHTPLMTDWAMLITGAVVR